jgi:hypothetical protein
LALVGLRPQPPEFENFAFTVISCINQAQITVKPDGKIGMSDRIHDATGLTPSAMKRM